MNHKIILLFIYLSLIFSENDNNYLWPTTASKTLTTVFGEERSRRFHAGIDVRTYGQIGDPLFAVYDGYVSRIKISPDGYGKTLYLKLNDGNTAVYAHIDKFQKSIEQKIISERTKTGQNFIDIFLKKNEIKFFRGDLIGYTGDTGSISGPHLHFEIRDKDNHPLNPLKGFYTIEDSLRPIAKSLAFIPLDNSCWINGVQDYSIFSLEKLNDYKYVLSDTISVLGNFGLAIEVEDKINNQPFSFNIYQMELAIDNKLVYKIKFDKYDMQYDHLIYNEIDFGLRTSKSKTFHRLYINNNEELEFIDQKSSKGFNVNSGYHYLNINISDINNNKIQIQGIIKGDIVLIPELKITEDIISSENGFENIIFNYTTRYENSRLIPMSFKQTESNIIELERPEKPYEIIQYYSTQKNGLVSNKKYIDMNIFDPYKINGDFNFKYFDHGIMIQFNEEKFSGYNASIISANKNDTISYKLFRNTKNVLSTKIIDYTNFNGINNIKIKYKTDPEIIFNKPIDGKHFKKNKFNEFYYGEYKLESFKNSLHNDVFIIIEDTLLTIDNNYKTIINPIKIMPGNISFNDFFSLSCTKNKFEGGLFNYNIKKNKWYFMESKSNSSSINTSLYSGGIFAVLNETTKPIIENIFPSNTASYTSKDIKEISFNIQDEHSGVNFENIIIKIDGQVLFYDCIKFRNLIKADINYNLDSGKHLLEIFVEDRLQNSITKEILFYIK